MLFLAAHLPPPSLADERALRTQLERALHAVPIHGERFRWKVVGVAQAFQMDAAEFAHPIGEPDSTLVSFGLGNPIFVIFRSRGAVQVEPILVPKDFDEDGVGPYRVLQAVWSRGRLFTLIRWVGGTGNSDYGRIFSLQHGRWRLVQELDTRGENAWEGDFNHKRIVSSYPLEICDTFLVRFPVDDHRSHSGTCLNYRESWRFFNGRLWRTSLQRIQTPYATLCDLFNDVEHRNRRRFGLSVAPELRRPMWQMFLKIRHTADNEESDCRDETPHLIVDHSLQVTFSRRHRRWVLTSISKKRSSN